jgi:hypothetical protein
MAVPQTLDIADRAARPPRHLLVLWAADWKRSQPEFPHCKRNIKQATARRGTGGSQSVVHRYNVGGRAGRHGYGFVSAELREPTLAANQRRLQHEIRPGMVLTADYLRNIETHTLLAIDTNHVGDARFFNLTNARQQNAVAVTNGNSSVAGRDIQLGSINCAITGATISASHDSQLTPRTDSIRDIPVARISCASAAEGPLTPNGCVPRH